MRLRVIDSGPFTPAASMAVISATVRSAILENMKDGDKSSTIIWTKLEEGTYKYLQLADN